MFKCDISCEFCREIKNFETSRFGITYKNKLANRILKQSKNFIIMPTIGQIIPKSLLLLPKVHYESFSEMPIAFVREASLLIEEVEKKMSPSGNIFFEHGARKSTNSSCGVYHAHMHIVPINKHINYRNIIGEKALAGISLEESLIQLKKVDNYVLFRNIDGAFYYNTNKIGPAEIFQSQYFRKWLVQNFEPQKEWDWKKYNIVEPDLLEIFR